MQQCDQIEGKKEGNDYVSPACPVEWCIEPAAAAQCPWSSQVITQIHTHSIPRPILHAHSTHPSLVFSPLTASPSARLPLQNRIAAVCGSCLARLKLFKSASSSVWTDAPHYVMHTCLALEFHMTLIYRRCSNCHTWKFSMAAVIFSRLLIFCCSKICSAPFITIFPSPLHASSLWTTPSGLRCPPGRKAVWGVAPAACALYGCNATSGQWPWLALGLRPLSEAGPQLNWAAAVQMNLGEKSGKEEKATEKWWIRRMQKIKKSGENTRWGQFNTVLINY